MTLKESWQRGLCTTFMLTAATVGVGSLAYPASAADGTTPTVTVPTPLQLAPAAPATCTKYVTIMSGSNQDEKVMKAAEFRSVVQTAPDLVTCGAVRADSDALCKLLDNEQAAKTCRAKRSTFHELKANPKGRGFMFNETQWEDCMRLDALKPYCDTFRDAARAGDATKCAEVGPIKPICTALIVGDKAQCSAPKGKWFDSKGEGGGTFGQALAKDCADQIESMRAYASGLPGLAESGSGSERILAKAALGQGDACTSYVQAAQTACIQTLEQAAAPTPGPPPASPPPAQSAPASAGAESTPAPSQSKQAQAGATAAPGKANAK